MDTAPTVTAPSGAVTDVSYSAEPATVCTVDPLTGALTLVGAGSCEITATAEGTDDYNEGTATYTVTVQTAGVLVLNVGAIATDNTINIAEKAAGFDISGDTGSEAGVTVTVAFSSAELTATSADDAGTARWLVSVLADATYITGTSIGLTVSAAKTGFTAPSDVQRTLTVDLTAPTAPTYTAPATLAVGTAITLISPSGGSGIDEYGATGLPSGLSLDTGTGVISGTPDTADANTASATVSVSDSAGNSATIDIPFPAVGKGDQTLTGFQYSASSVTFGSAAPTLTAPTGAQTTLSYSAAPSTVCTVNDSTGALTLVSTGACTITAKAEGTADYNEATAPFTVTVQAAGVLVLNVSTIATDNIINIAEKASGFDISGDTGTETGVDVTVQIGTATLTTTSADDAGTAVWTVSVPSNATYIAGASVDVTVSASKTGFTAPADVERTLTVGLTAPTAPSYAAPSSLKVGEAITPISPLGGAGIDEYGAAGLPSGLSLDDSTGVISGTPDTADANTASATVSVSDSAGNPATVDIPFPAVGKGDQTLTGFGYSASSVTLVDAAPTVTAPSGAVTDMSYLAEPATVCTVDPSTGALTLVGAGSCEITAKAEGTADYNEATAPFTVTVQTAGVLVLNMSAIATDSIINIAEKAAGFDISGDTGTETGVSISVEVGSTTLTTTSADDAGTATWSVSIPSDATYIAGASVDVTVSASKTGFTAPADVERTLTVDLSAPTAPSYAAPSSLKVGEAITPIGPSGGAGIDEYGATGLPSGLSLDTGTGVISGTPDTADASTADATVTVSDSAGNPATVDIPFPAVDKGDQTLTGFGYSASSVTLVDAAPTVTAPSGAVTDVSYLAEPATVCTVDPLTGALTLVGAGSCEITATAEGTADYNEATAPFTVTVQAAGNLVLNVGAIATDNVINIAEKAAGFDISGDTGTESGVDVTVQIGTATLTTTSADDSGTATWSVSVLADATYITGASVDVTVSAAKTGFTAPSDVQRALTVALTAPTAPTYAAPSSLKVGEAITPIGPSGGAGIDEYGAAGLPSGLSLDDSTGVISGTPDTADANTASSTVSVSDSAGNSATIDIPFPAVGKGDQTLTGFGYSASSVTLVDAAPTVTAPSGAVTDVSYLATPATVCTVDPSTGALTLVGAGSCEITAKAEGTADYNEATAPFTVTVQAAGNLVVNVGAIATDNVINIAEKASGFDINGDTGSEAGVTVTVTLGSTELTATSADDAGTARWLVSVLADATYITGTSVDVTVSAAKTGFTAPSDIERTLTVDLTAPTAPSYTAPATLAVGTAITLISPSGGSGIDEYGATGLPSGLSLDDSTGVISGTPDTADANTASATVSVSDSAGNPATVDIPFPAVDKGDQTLTGFSYSASSVTLVDTAPTVTAPSGAVTDVSYLAEPATVCTVDLSTGALTLVGAGSCEITATAEGTADYNEATAPFTVTVQTAGNLVLNVGAIATDNVINIAEKASGFDISGDTGSEIGVSVSVEIGSTTLTTTSADDAGTAAWSVSVPADAPYISGIRELVEVNASKTGYTTPVAVRRSLTVDLTAPTAPSYSAPSALQVGEAISAMNPSGGSGIDEYGATGLPSGLSLDTGTGVISATPDTADAGTADATVTVSDSAGNSATVDIPFPAVDKGDQTLTGFSYSASSVKLGAAAPSVTAPTGVLTTLSYSATPTEVCRVHPSTGALTLLNAGTCAIIATAASSANYEEASATYTVTAREVETTLTVSRAAVDEQGGATSVTVTGALDGVTRDVPTILTVSVGADDDAAIEGTDYAAVNDLSLTIASGETSGTVTFTLATIDDFIDERVEAVSITGTIEDAGFEVIGTTVSITDNDERGVQINLTSLTVPEGGEATYTVVLTSQPTGEVTVTPSLGLGDTDVTVSAALTFDATTWDQAQTVTVLAAQDADAANDTATIAHPVSGADYGANSVLADDVSVIVDDDETALTLTVSRAAVDEQGGATSVTVTGALDGVTRDVPTILTVSVGADDDAAIEGTDYAAVNDLSLTIASGETSGTVTFTLATIDDFIDERVEAVSITGTIEDAGFEVIGTTVSITDNDERGVQINLTSLTVPEGGEATYTVVLTSQPTGEVTVTPSLGLGDTDVTVSAALTFDATTWDQAQTVTVLAAQDADAANDTATIAHPVSGADYGANSVLADDVSVIVDDDETALTLTVSRAAVDEQGGATSVTVTGALDGVTRDVPTILTVSVGADDDAAIEGTDYAAVNDLSLTIASGETSGTVTFTLATIDDFIDERVEAVSITGTIEDAGFEVIGTTVSITDNDERGVTVSPIDLTLTEGASATYTVVLDTEPTETVTVTPSVSGSPDLTFRPSSLTFTSSDWDTAQTMTVSATEDDDAYHDSSIISHAAEGAEYASLVDGAISVTISDNEVGSQGELPAQVRDLSATATATQVDLTWSAVQETVLGYRVEASYDGGANWAEVEDNTESTDTTYRHDVGLNFAETRRYRVSAVSGNGAGLPSVFVQASATATTGGLTATVAVPENATDAMSEDTPDPMPDGATDPVPAVDLCWIPQGVAASELSDAAIAWTPDHSSGSVDLSDLPWQSIGSGSSEVDCEDGIGIRVTSISENQRYAFRMRANHGGAWLVSNDAQALWVDLSKPLRTVVTAGASGLSGDTQVPALICRNFNDPATREDEQGSFFISVGFTTAAPEYLRYEPVTGFDPSSDLTLVNATAKRLDRPHDTRLGYRVRITPSVWGEPVAVSLANDVVTHEATSVGNQASGEFRRETADSVDCDTSAPELARRSQVTAARFEQDGDRNGEWTIGELIRVTLQFDEPVHVTTTDGVPSVTLTIGEAATEATEQSSDGEAATEVTATFSRVAHEDTLVFEHLVTAQQSPIRDITLLADSLSLNGGEIDSFSGPAVDLAHAEAAVADGQFVLPELTAGWPMIPGAHEGSESSFEIHLKFSEAVDLIEVIGEQNLLEHAFTVTGGSIEAIWPARDGGGEVLANQWAMRVLAASEGPVTIAPVVDLACDQPGAICTIDDRLLTEAPSVTVQRTEQGLSVADAEVGEGPGAVLVFGVTLARTADHPVTVDYETADGTAAAGQDYEAASGTLRIEAGQTTGRVRVKIIDDSHDEGEETLTLILTNATNARIHDGEALGIIVNSDPIPGAWLARFGRAASDHVAQAVARRLERGPREQHITVGGLRLDHLFTSSAAPDAGRAAGSGSNNTQLAGGFDAQGAPGDMAAPNGRPSRGSETLPDLRNALLGSSFFYTFGGSEDASTGSVAAWGETASTRFQGSEGTLSLDGEVTTAVLGLDKRYGRWLVGSTLSFSEGEGGYRRPGVLGGSMESTLASLNPYAHYELNDTTSLWGVLGYGRGTLRLTPQGAESALETALSNRMAAFGGRGLLQVRSGEAGRFELVLRSDALLTRTHSEAVQGLEAAQVATSRVRLLLEGSGSVPVWSGMLSPSLEAGLRYDGGDAETGAGIEIGGGLGYTAGRVSVQVNARGLLAHQDTEYEEWGFSGSIAYIPSEDGRGLSMKLGLGWGASQSGVQSLWNPQDTSGLVRGTDFDAGQRLESEISYGLEGLNGRGLWVPFVGARTSDGAQDYRMGLKLIAGANAEAQLEIGRREQAARPPDDAIRLLGKLRW